MIRPLLAPIALAALLALSTNARASDGAAQYRLASACDDWKMVHDIVSRFGWAERGFGSGVGIERLDAIRQTGFAPVGTGKIERRYCQATARLSGAKRPATVYYLIESEQGYVGLGSRVEFCVAGFDRWHVHDADCNTVRPLYNRRG